MGLLNDPNYRPEWDRQPANDKIHPWVGLLSELLNRPPPDVPSGGERAPDAFPYALRIPLPADDDRAYNPTLQYEDSAPGLREAEMKRRMRLQNYNADTFRQPKTLDEAGIRPYSGGERLLDLLRQWYQPDWMAGK
jgi:hypothetical protein